MSTTMRSAPRQRDNPLGLAGIEFIEFAAFYEAESRALVGVLEALGFVRVARHRSKNVVLYRQGDVNLVLDLEPNSLAHAFATVHGMSVCALAFRVADARAAHAAALRHGAKDYQGERGPGELPIPAVRNVSGGLIYFVDRFGAKGSIYEIDFEAEPVSGPASKATGLTGVDHISQSVLRGRTRRWADFYAQLFGFLEVDYNCIADPEGYVLSTVITPPDGNIPICINEPVDDGTDCDRFLKANFGEGVHHVAFGTPDIMGFLKAAKRRKLEILTIPASYYRDLGKEGFDRALVDRLRRHNVMIDTEGGGRFLHAYTRPFSNRFFFEVVQRDNHHGFGRHDATARLIALQGRKGLGRHVRERPPTVERYGPAIDNQTVLMGTVGHPVGDLRTPELMGRWLPRHGLNVAWLPFDVAPSALRRFVAGARGIANLGGFTVGAPHKAAIVPLLDEVSERARRVGTVNVVRRDGKGRLVGDLMEGPGFLKALKGLGVEVRGAAVWLVGAGTFGRAIAFALAEAGARSLTIQDLAGENARRLRTELRALFPDVAVGIGEPAARGIDIAVNATSAGMRHDDLPPLDPGRLGSGAVVVETILVPEETHLVLEATRHGCVVCRGANILEGQLDFFVEFLGLAP